MNKDIIKQIIVENQEFLIKIECRQREYNLEPRANYVITGPRRAGKTYFIFHHIKQHFENELTRVLYINFEDERLLELKAENLDILIKCFRELYNETPILFFDEIQNIIGWEKFVRRLADQKYRIYVTGSNAQMLSKEIATTLGGRFLIKEIHPLSFSEYLKFNNIDLQPNYAFSEQQYVVKQHFENYLKYGGFPDTLNFKHPKQYLNSLYQKVFYSDILSRYSVNNDYVMRLMVKKIAESVTNETSFNRIKNIIKSTGAKVGTATLIDYFGYMHESFLIYSISNYAHALSERESRRKFYFADTGILNLFLSEQPQQLLENLVFIQLWRLYSEEVYYIQKDVETDFYIPEKQQLIQVCWNMSNYNTREREINSLLKIAKRYGYKKGKIITSDETETITEKGIEIEIVPAWKWLLQANKISEGI